MVNLSSYLFFTFQQFCQTNQDLSSNFISIRINSERKQTFIISQSNKKKKMIRSSANSMIKLTNQRNIYLKQHNSISTNYLISKALINKDYFLFSSNRSKLVYGFSTNDKKPVTKVQQNKPSTQQYQPKHRQKQSEQEYIQNAEISPDGQKLDDDKSTPFVPSAFGNYFIGISCVCLILAYAVMEVQFMRASNAKKSPAQGAKKVIAKGKAHIGGDWELIGTDGKAISHKDFSGKYYLIYFGFCNCPDICPNSLMKLAKAVQKVKKTTDSKYFNLESVFISVDPDRDTLQKVQKFAKYFDKSMIGVTGKSNDDPALKQCMKKFKIYSSKIQFQDQDSVIKGRKSYTIDHTILTYLMNPQNEYVAHIGANLGQHDMAKLILQKIKEDQRVSMQKLKI